MSVRQLFVCIVAVCCTILPVFAQETPWKWVVQVVGYENVYGKTPRMIGRGSASIIDGAWTLLTNNHVVDNGFGGTLDGFSICVSVAQTERPKCIYTASLVTRDIERDIAVLRLDPTDIFGNPVVMSQFTPIPLATEYVPTSQDPVIAIGYPRVGADTITQTAGVVAGTQAYNGVTYIKTDALIAGGNSGWPLIKDGAVVGVNTFGIGGFSDASLGYALLIKEAGELIASAKSLWIVSWFDRVIFQNYLRTIFDTNEKGTLTDAIFTLHLGGGYRITEYEPNRLVVSYQMLPDKTSVQAFLIERFQTPELKTPQELSYYLEKNGLYAPGYEKMKPVQIGGIPMFDIFPKTDPSEWLSMGYKKFVAQLTPTDILFFTVQTPTYDESLYEKAKQKLDEFLWNVTFHIPSSASSQEKKVELKDPKVTLLGGATSEKPFTRWGRWDGSLRAMRYSVGVIRTMLDSLHESIRVNVYPQTRDVGRGTSVDELMKVKIQDITTTHKGKIWLQGHEWFYYCQSNSAYMLTKQGQWVPGDSCSAFIVLAAGETNDLPYIIEVQLQTESKNSEKNRERFFEYMQQSIQVQPVGDGKTEITKTLGSEKLFDDLDKQHPDFANVITYLVRYKILIKNRPHFDGDMAMTWWDVIKVYFKWVMAVNMDAAAETCGYPVQYRCLFQTQMITIAWEQHPIQKLVDDLQINIQEYASIDKLYVFDSIIKLYLAGVKDVPFTQWDLQKFSDTGQLVYASARQHVQDREYNFFGKRRIQLQEVVPVYNWSSPTQVSWHPKVGLWHTADALRPITFDVTPLYTSYTPSVLLQVCKNNMACYDQENNQRIAVVTLWELVNSFLPLIDRAKFMPELESKKESGEYYGPYYG